MEPHEPDQPPEVHPDSSVRRFSRTDGRSGGGNLCDGCGKAWIYHVAPGCLCPDAPEVHPADAPPQNGPAGAIWDWAEALSRRTRAAAAIKAKQRRSARNTRARSRYAIQKKLGTLPVRGKALADKRAAEVAAERQDEEDRLQEVASSCHCSSCSRPPCSYCEGGWRDYK